MIKCAGVYGCKAQSEDGEGWTVVNGAYVCPDCAALLPKRKCSCCCDKEDCCEDKEE